MKTTEFLALLLTLLPLRVSAATGSADSDELPVELGSARSVAAAINSSLSRMDALMPGTRGKWPQVSRPMSASRQFFRVRVGP